jgi:hypothetical protein
MLLDFSPDSSDSISFHIQKSSAPGASANPYSSDRMVSRDADLMHQRHTANTVSRCLP